MARLVEASKAHLQGDQETRGELRPPRSAKNVGVVGLHGEKPSSLRSGHRLHWLESEHIVPFAAGKSLWRALSLYLPSRGSREDNAQTTIMVYFGAARIKTPADNARSYSFKAILEASGIARTIERAEKTGQTSSESTDAEAKVRSYLEEIRQDAVARTKDAVRTENEMIENSKTKSNGQRRGNEPPKPTDGQIEAASQTQMRNIEDLVAQELRHRDEVREKVERINQRRRHR